MILRVQSKDGTRRIQAEPSYTLQRFLEKVISDFQLRTSDTFSLYRSPGLKDELTRLHLPMQLQHIPLNHGDMLYLAEKKPSSAGAREPVAMVAGVQEEAVDCALAARDGKINRQRDPQLCHHGSEAKCMNCAPLDPWDPRHLASFDPPIKHLSFHCYLRRLTSGVDRGKFLNLEDLRCKIRENCLDHPPWPAGICTKCQPSAVTLSRQPYRHVDNVMFDHPGIVDRFLDGWRLSGRQRAGLLLGQYTEYEDVPLGIRAVVSAVYEPPQESTRHSIELLEDPHQLAMQELATHLGLQQVGWIFTDLEPEGKDGKVAYKRSVHSHLLTAEECILAADLQNKHPNPCRHASSGYFGSKFTTLCVSGNEQHEVEIRGYQVSNQCMALVRDDCLVPTLDAKELGYIRESTPQQYVPDVFYKTRGEYGVDVTKEARPLPLEYLIIELTTSSPRNPLPMLPGGKGPAFPVENRAAVGQPVQDFHTLSAYLASQQTSSFLCFMADFHLLFFLYTCDVAGIQMKPHLPRLCRAIVEGNKADAETWRCGDHWSTLEQLIVATNSSPGHIPSSAGLVGTGEQWACLQCTLLNPAHSTVCDVCQFPRSSPS